MRANALLRALTVAVIVGLPVVSACEDDPLSAGLGEVTELDVSLKQASETVAGPFTVTVVVRDDQYNTIAEEVTATSSAPNVVRVDSVVYVNATGKNIVYLTPLVWDTTGNVRILYQAGGLQDTTVVRVFPNGIKVTAPDTVVSGDTIRLTPIGLDKTGAEIGVVPTSVTDAGAANVTDVVADGSDWLVIAKDPGTAMIEITGPGGKISGTISIVVVAGEFAGTMSASSGAGGTRIALAAAAGQPRYDDDTRVLIDGFPAHVRIHPDTIYAVLPYTWAAGEYSIQVVSIGAEQVSLDAGTVQITSQVDAAPELAGVQALPLFVVGTVSGADQEDGFDISVSEETTIELTLPWNYDAAGDLDLEVYNAAGDLVCYSWSSTPEHVTCTLDPGDYYISVFNYTAYAGGSQAPVIYHLSAVKKE